MSNITFKIIAVEDDADDRFLLDEAFKQIGYEADIKKLIDGDYLLEYLGKIEKEKYPSLIVLDNSLPKKNAVEILVQLKENKEYSHIPVIIYSTAMSLQQKEKLLALGAIACLKKGVAMHEIIEAATLFKQVAEAKSQGIEPQPL
jgi:CheY-like chemotaxis protein